MWEKVPKVQTINKVILSYNYKPMVQGGFISLKYIFGIYLHPFAWICSNGRSCTVNTVLWNTIQLLFPKEVEARKAAGALNSREAGCKTPETAFYNNLRNGSTRASGVSSRDTSARRRRGTSSQDENAALAIRSQRGGEDHSQERRGVFNNVRSRRDRKSVV